MYKAAKTRLSQELWSIVVHSLPLAQFVMAETHAVLTWSLENDDGKSTRIHPVLERGLWGSLHPIVGSHAGISGVKSHAFRHLRDIIREEKDFVAEGKRRGISCGSDVYLFSQAGIRGVLGGRLRKPNLAELPLQNP